MTISLEDLLSMPQSELRAVLHRAHPIPVEALEETQYLGVDLSLPPFANKLLWKTFRKTFHRDAATGALRGWNVRVHQTGWDAPTRAMTDAKGRARSFGHYVLRDARAESFPRGWKGRDFLDYTHAGNAWYDPAALGWCPLVAVNPDDPSLLLGWEVFVVGGVFIPLPDFWALRREGPLDEVVSPPSG